MSKHLIPREHGAYAELGFPLVAGLVLGRPGLAGWLFVLAAILLFLANESVVVLVGARGKRAREENGPAAKRTLAILGGLGVAAGLAALA
ncbi:MAG TPA: YwiC-like family protein, partial [Usitatibacteraceae bacterium]|nr:YwiC-like family protein [Usitatibacteraceae bacterium]